ncbi:MAG: hypothetical protein FIB04_10465 [Gammaproteobacteria bacterium]|nr:hypothetical protein [Gammaproteobacteria bacterium]
MPIRPLPASLLPLILAAALAAGCAPADKGEAPARKSIDAVDAAIKAAGPDATKYLPSHVSKLEAQSTRLKVKYYERDYQGIADAAPAVLEQAQGLAQQAAAKKAEIATSLAPEWTGLESSVPAAIAAVEKRADELQKSGKVPAAGPMRMMLDATPASVADQKALWEKATAAKAAGDIEQAVTIGNLVKHKAETLLSALGSNG